VSLTLGEAHDRLVGAAGGYLRNTFHEEFVTCRVCRTPVDGYQRCGPCSRARAGWPKPPLADRVASITYAVKGEQGGHLMRQYKAPAPTTGARAQSIVQYAFMGALVGHTACVSVLAGTAVTHWAAVPAVSSGRTGEHPLHSLVAPIMRLFPEVPVEVAIRDSQRIVREDRFTVPPVPSGHVLVIDDTWTTGSQVQSLAWALRLAGAETVSVLVMARWLDPDWVPSQNLIRSLPGRTFDPDVCPWTGAACP